MAPSGTPPAVIERIAAEATRLLQTPAIAERFRLNGLEPEGTTPAAFTKTVVSDSAKWLELVQTNHIKPE
jgi:tripartite-type tricarboxylate transporter receptor subunit TctC